MRTRTTVNKRGPRSRSVSFEVGVELPRADLLLIALPLHLLRLDKTFQKVDTQRLAHHLVLAQVFERLGEGTREMAELVAREPLGVERIEVLFDRRRQWQLLADPREPGMEHRGERQVGVAGGVRRPELDPDRGAIAATGTGYPDQRRPVHLSPPDSHR